MQQILEKAKKDFEDVLKLIADDLKTVKTGRAKPSLVEDVKVEVYGTVMTLKELASISIPDPHQIVVSPWDKSILEAIEKGIASAGLNLNPVVDGDLIRIAIPPLTEETRRDLVKLVNQKLESGRRLLRQARQEAKEVIDNMKGQSGVSEDDIHHNLEELQKLVDEFNDKIEQLGKAKEKELMTI